MTKRKLPRVGQEVTYTRDALLTFRGRVDWRGVVEAMHPAATDAWPLAIIRWTRGPGLKLPAGESETAGTSHVNLHALCTPRSVPFIEGQPPLPLI